MAKSEAPPKPSRTMKRDGNKPAKAARRPADADNDDAAVFADERFARIARDPRFRKMKRDSGKVEIDERFEKMLDSEEFGYVGGQNGRPL